MAKLVVLSEGLTGQSYELKVDKTTVGRVEDNTFQIVHPSVSSHHCEVLLRGNDVVVKDMNSTNGTFINNQQITDEAVLKPGQVMRLGQVEVRLESGVPASASAPGKKLVDSTMVISKGVSLEQLEQGPHVGFDTTKGGFTRKTDKTNRYFIWGMVLFCVVVGGVLAYLILQFGSNHASH
jgi:pSer/pThr/pTyr-binding forkhead associated (FHA) protein